MRYRRLGDSELEVSELALGSWLTYGVTVDRDRARECVRRAFDVGINFFDTANLYGRGSTESLLGEVLSSYRRDSYLLATKVYYPMSDTDSGLSREQIRKQIDASLERLRTDYVDLYQCHAFDRDTPLEETMAAMNEVVDAGKARYVGFCNWRPRHVRAAAGLANGTRFVSSQPQYSMLRRTPERRLFPLCTRLGISQIVWSPLAQGVLTGKYAPGQSPPKDSRASRRKIRRQIRRFNKPAILEAVQQLRPVAERLSLSMAQLALAWVLREKCVSAAIIGASRPEQVEENAGAVGVELDEESCRDIDRMLNGVVRR
ncbi:MAG: aldo/keto reductase family protein [Woeseiaceae bacterium]